MKKISRKLNHAIEKMSSTQQDYLNIFDSLLDSFESLAFTKLAPRLSNKEVEVICLDDSPVKDNSENDSGDKDLDSEFKVPEVKEEFLNPPSPTTSSSKHTENLDVSKPSENLDVSKPSENLDVPKPSENLDVPKPSENLDVPKSSENLNVPKPSENLKVNDDTQILIDNVSLYSSFLSILQTFSYEFFFSALQKIHRSNEKIQ